MNKLLLNLVLLWETLSASTASLASNLGEDKFRTAEISVGLSTQTDYDMVATYPAPLITNSIDLALLMVDYSQSFDSSNKIHFDLIKNTPTSSNNTNAVFRVMIGFPSLTTRAKVKYLAFSTSVLS